jgi:hypothetical protein
VRGVPLKPKWDKKLRTLFWGDKRLKIFKKEADDQEAILDRLQEESWAKRVRVILPSVPARDPKDHLRRTVENMNRWLADGPIRFRTDGALGVLWEVRRAVRKRRR